MWQIRMLGRFEVVSPEARSASFRSRKVGSLLAFLALNKGRDIANSTLQDLLWPESDGDKQSQSLRRAIADLRDALEAEGNRRTIVLTEQGRTSLDPEAIATDAEQFEALLAEAEASPDFDVRTASALALYGGPLLAPLEEDWVFAYRRQFEETYCRAVESLCKLLTERGQGREAVRIAHAAIVFAPYREETYLASIRAYAATGNRSMALQQYEALETMLDDEFGQTPSEEAMAAVDGPSIPYPGLPNATPKSATTIAVSGGGVDAESRFYVERDSDTSAGAALDAMEPVVLVFGPRQVGKTSLIARCASRLRAEGVRVVVSDFQALGRSEIERSATLYRALIHGFASQLGLEYEPSWNEWVGANSNLDEQIDKLLRQTEGRICWAMDEVDRLFGTDYADDFFGLVRSWHNRRALDPEGPWKRLTLLISYATEAHLFIKDVNQSPFNVGVRINLRDFTASQTEDLARRYGYDAAISAEVFAITQGHPFLTRRAFGFLQGGRRIEELQDAAPREDGPFGEHLKRLFEMVRLDSVMESTIRSLLTNEPVEDQSSIERLQTAGLLRPATTGEAVFRTPVYVTYLQKALG